MHVKRKNETKNVVASLLYNVAIFLFICRE